MATWKNASAVFTGGTAQIQQFKGRKVRAKVAMQLGLYDPVNNTQAVTTLMPGAIGLVSNPHPTALVGLLIAFDKRPGAMVTTLDSMMRGGSFQVVVVNEPTFKMQFEVES